MEVGKLGDRDVGGDRRCGLLAMTGVNMLK
jgi:hypothetical protein